MPDNCGLVDFKIKNGIVVVIPRNCQLCGLQDATAKTTLNFCNVGGLQLKHCFNGYDCSQVFALETVTLLQPRRILALNVEPYIGTTRVQTIQSMKKCRLARFVLAY